MKVIYYSNFDLFILSYKDGQQYVEARLVDATGNEFNDTVKYSHIETLRGGDRLPAENYGEDGRLKLNTPFPVVRLTLADGTYRYAQNEKRWREILVPTDVDMEEITLLEEHMRKGESQIAEFKGSAVHPADPNNKDDHSYQMKELIKQLVAGANSKTHKLTVYVGVKDDGNKRIVTGIESEFAEYCKGCTAELFQCHFINTLKELTSESLLMSVSYKYIAYKGHTVLKLEVDHKGDIVFYRGRELYTRLGSAMHQITDNQAFLSFIRSYKCAD